MGGHARDLVKVFLCVLECNLCKLRSGWKTVCGCDLNLVTERLQYYVCEIEYEVIPTLNLTYL